MENITNETNTVIQQDLCDIVGNSFLDYAMSVITDRALPDINDGLKPVQRKILYSMYVNNLTPSANYHKCATTVGHVIGAFSPHGDTSTYDALVNLSQPINTRYPLIDFNGNNGNPLDGDPAAAYRYCVTGDTIIKTNHGNMPIERLSAYTDDQDNLHDIFIEDYRGQMVPATKFFNSGNHETYKVTLKNGQSIRCTSNHPLMILDDNLSFSWKTIEQLNVNDKILIPHFISNSKNDNFSVTEQELVMAKALGAIVSEGYITTQNRIGINNTYLPIIEIVKAWFEILSKNLHATINKHENIYEYCIADGNIHKMFMYNNDFMIGNNSYERCIPNIILSNNKIIQAAFLQYLFEGDGGVTKNNYIFYSSRSKKLLQQIQIILNHTFGIFSYIVYDNSEKNDHKLYISDFFDLLKFSIEIDFLSDRKIDALTSLIENKSHISIANNSYSNIHEISKYIRLKANKNREYINKYNFSNYQQYNKCKSYINELDYNKIENLVFNYRYIPIESIESAGIDTVYSVRVDNEDSDHSFIANGFINHNTESKLSGIGYDMLDNIDKNTVDFMPNFDNTKIEPTILSGLIPNLLINGSSGIAVGMACNLMPHNLNEVYDALIYYIDQTIANEEIDENKVFSIIKGPDFPIGGTIIGRNSIRDYFRTGRGSIIVKANYTTKALKNGTTQIIFNDLPFKVNKSELVRHLDKLKETNVLPEIREIRDESSKDCYVRIVIDVKKDANIDLLLNKLYKMSSLQTSIGVNNVVLIDGKPETVNLDTMLTSFLAHSVNVVYNAIAYDNEKLNNKINTVNAIIKTAQNIDTIIPILKSSDNELEDLRNTHIFDNDIQIEYVLGMPLKNISHINLNKYTEELNNLEAKSDEYNKLLSDQNTLLSYIKDRYVALKKKYGDARRTVIEETEYSILDEAELIAEESIVVSYTNNDIIKSVSEKEYKTQSRNGKGINQYINETDNDSIKKIIYMSNKDDLLFFTNTGRCHILKAYKIAKVSKTTKGKHINNYIKLDTGEKVVNIIAADTEAKHSSFVFVTRNGIVKKMSFDLLPKRGNVTKVASLVDNDMLADVDVIDNSQETCSIVLVTAQGKVLSISQDKVRASGKSSRGVKGMKLHNNDYVVKVLISTDKDKTTKEHLLTVTENGFAKQTSCSVYADKGRNGSGVTSHKITNESGQIVSAVITTANDELLVSTKYGKMIRLKVSDIRACGRISTGVRLIKLQDNDIIASVSIIDTAQENQE